MDGAGHVAIVEEIEQNGNITCSNSAWQSTFFFLTNLLANNNYSYSHFTFQGFIYNPFADQPIPPSPISKNANKWLQYMSRRKRIIY
ncbi:MAG: hypothetical protein ACLVAK_09735 [Clostridia bacterium]